MAKVKLFGEKETVQAETTNEHQWTWINRMFSSRKMWRWVTIQWA